MDNLSLINSIVMRFSKGNGYLKTSDAMIVGVLSQYKEKPMTQKTNLL